MSVGDEESKVLIIHGDLGPQQGIQRVQPQLLIPQSLRKTEAASHAA